MQIIFFVIVDLKLWNMVYCHMASNILMKTWAPLFLLTRWCGRHYILWKLELNLFFVDEISDFFYLFFPT